MNNPNEIFTDMRVSRFIEIIRPHRERIEDTFEGIVDHEGFVQLLTQILELTPEEIHSLEQDGDSEENQMMSFAISIMEDTFQNRYGTVGNFLENINDEGTDYTDDDEDGDEDEDENDDEERNQDEDRGNIQNEAQIRRSKRGKENPPDFAVLSNKRRNTNPITLEPEREGATITLSDGQTYGLSSIVNMWKWSKVQTPNRHPYNENDKILITQFLDFHNYDKNGNRRGGGKGTRVTKRINKNKTNLKRKTIKRKTIKRKTMKRKTMKRKTMKRKK
jgi:hypothetical protein